MIKNKEREENDEIINGIVLDKAHDFGELKFSALRREVRIQNTRSVSEKS